MFTLDHVAVSAHAHTADLARGTAATAPAQAAPTDVECHGSVDAYTALHATMHVNEAVNNVGSVACVAATGSKRRRAGVRAASMAAERASRRAARQLLLH